ncbi:MAG: hypothetical protein AAF334_00950 [Pseudomonadota bacterium]
MHDWFVTVLVSVRDMAARSGMVALAEEMDVAILVAANECHERDMNDLGTVDVDKGQYTAGTPGNPVNDGKARRYH